MSFTTAELNEQINALAVWSEKYELKHICPVCEKEAIHLLDITLKSIVLQCTACGKKLFYRRIEHI